jgi:hypothetical protein
MQTKGRTWMKLHRAVGSVGTGVDIVVMSLAEYDRLSQVP